MARPCTVCHSEAVEEVNRRLLDGAAFRDLSKQFRLTPAALHRHKHHHLGPLLVQAKAAADAEAGTDVLGAALAKLASIESEARRLAAAAEAKGQFAVAGNLLVTQAVRLVELTARLEGLLTANAQVNVAVAAQVTPDQKVAGLTWLAAKINAATPEERGAVVGFLRRLRSEAIAREVEETRQRLDALEPPRYSTGASPNGQRPLLPGGAEPVERMDSGDRRAQVRALAEGFGWPTLALRPGLVIAQEEGWRRFTTGASVADVRLALAALRAVAPASDTPEAS